MKIVRRLFGAVFLLLAVATASSAVAVSLRCTGREPVNLTPLPDPMETLSLFFDRLCAGDYAHSYTCLDGYDSLGLENTPEDAHAAAFWALIRDNCSWSAEGCTVSGTLATAEVSLRYPDLAAATKALGDDVNALIEARVDEAADTSEIYDEAGGYRRAFVLALYDEALQARLQGAELPYRTESFPVTLKYIDGAWRIVPDSRLLAALSGGTV